MTVKDVHNALKNTLGDTHIVVTILPTEQLVIPKRGQRFEISRLQQDAHGVINIIASVSAGEVDPQLGEKHG